MDDSLDCGLMWAEGEKEENESARGGREAAFLWEVEGPSRPRVILSRDARAYSPEDLCVWLRSHGSPLLIEIVYVLVCSILDLILLVELREKVSRERVDGAAIGSIRGDSFSKEDRKVLSRLDGLAGTRVVSAHCGSRHEWL